MTQAAQFSDLRTRVISAFVLLCVGGIALWFGGLAFDALIVLASGLMAWETLRMHDCPPKILILGAIAFAVATGLVIYLPGMGVTLAAVVLIAILCGVVGKSRMTTALALIVILFACFALAKTRANALTPVLWLIGCVIASDVGGYFAGRIFGGPKFWPAISPKKTWSGTIGGWVLAALVAFGFYLSGYQTLAIVWLGILIAMAAQAGDLAESFMKRRAGIKDSSNLIPGHGGLLDRFDGLMGAGVAFGIFAKLTGNWG